MDFAVRAEELADRGAIFDVVAAAFNSRTEPELVDAIRASENFVGDWSLVATVDNRVVGHVLVSYVTLKRDVDEVRIASLAPLAVHPDFHKRGVGSTLVGAVRARVDAAEEPLIILEGDPAYYSRFGFEPATEYGIELTLPDWAPPEAAQVLRLRAYDPKLRGRVVYPPAFDGVT